VSGYVVDIRPKMDDNKTDIRSSPLAHAKRVFTFFLQELFKQDNPTGLLYSNDVKVTGIIIKGAYAKNQETYQKKPMIVVDRGGAQIASRTLGSIENVDYRTGGYTRTEQVPFSLISRVVSENEFEAEKVAWFIASTAFILRHVLIRQGFYYVANQMMVSPPTPPMGLVPGDQTNLVMIQLQLPCSHLMTGRFVPLNRPALSDVSTKLVDSGTGEVLSDEDEASQP
jgi:hypothetical protein